MSIAGWRITASSMSSNSAGDMRTDRIGDELAHGFALRAAAGDGEMIAPEPDQPFTKRRRRYQGPAQHGEGIAAEIAVARRLGAEHAVLPVRAQPLHRGTEIGDGLIGGRVRLAYLGAQPGMRVGGDRLRPAPLPSPKRTSACAVVMSMPPVYRLRVLPNVTKREGGRTVLVSPCFTIRCLQIALGYAHEPRTKPACRGRTSAGARGLIEVMGTPRRPS